MKKWDNLVEICHESSFEAAPKPKKTKKSNNPEIIKLASKQKDLNKKINANLTRKKQQEICKERNNVKSDLRKLIVEEKKSALDG